MSQVTNNATEATIRNASILNTNRTRSRQTFDPARIFAIMGHGEETKIQVNRNTKHFRTTIKNNVLVESEFPRIKVPANVFMTFTSQLGLQQSPAPHYIASFSLLNRHPINVPQLTSGYNSYKDQIYQLGNDVFDNTFLKISSEVDSVGGEFAMQQVAYDYQDYSGDISNMRFRSYGSIPRTSNIQDRNDTFLFFAPNTNVKIHTTEASFEDEVFEEDILNIIQIMISGVAPINELQRRFPVDPSNPNFKLYSFYFIGSIARDYTFGEIESDIDTILASVSSTIKESFVNYLKKMIDDKPETFWHTSIAHVETMKSSGSVNDTDIKAFLLAQVDMLRNHWVWGISLTEEDFLAKKFREIVNTKTTTQNLINKIIETVGNDRPILTIDYHCRSLITTAERSNLNYSSITSAIIEKMRNRSLNNEQRTTNIKALKAQRNLIKKKANMYENYWNSEKGMTRKIARLEENNGSINQNTRTQETTKFGRPLERYGRPILSRQLSMAANPLKKRNQTTSGGRRKRRSLRTTRKRKNSL